MVINGWNKTMQSGKHGLTEDEDKQTEKENL